MKEQQELNEFSFSLQKKEVHKSNIRSENLEKNKNPEFFEHQSASNMHITNKSIQFSYIPRGQSLPRQYTHELSDKKKTGDKPSISQKKSSMSLMSHSRMSSISNISFTIQTKCSLILQQKSISSDKQKESFGVYFLNEQKVKFVKQTLNNKMKYNRAVKTNFQPLYQDLIKIEKILETLQFTEKQIKFLKSNTNVEECYIRKLQQIKEFQEIYEELKAQQNNSNIYKNEASIELAKYRTFNAEQIKCKIAEISCKIQNIQNCLKQINCSHKQELINQDLQKQPQIPQIASISSISSIKYLNYVTNNNFTVGHKKFLTQPSQYLNHNLRNMKWWHQFNSDQSNQQKLNKHTSLQQQILQRLKSAKKNITFDKYLLVDCRQESFVDALMKGHFPEPFVKKARDFLKTQPESDFLESKLACLFDIHDKHHLDNYQQVKKLLKQLIDSKIKCKKENMHYEIANSLLKYDQIKASEILSIFKSTIGDLLQSQILAEQQIFPLLTNELFQKKISVLQGEKFEQISEQQAFMAIRLIFRRIRLIKVWNSSENRQMKLDLLETSLRYLLRNQLKNYTKTVQQNMLSLITTKSHILSANIDIEYMFQLTSTIILQKKIIIETEMLFELVKKSIQQQNQIKFSKFMSNMLTKLVEKNIIQPKIVIKYFWSFINNKQSTTNMKIFCLQLITQMIKQQNILLKNSKQVQIQIQGQSNSIGNNLLIETTTSILFTLQQVKQDIIVLLQPPNQGHLTLNQVIYKFLQYVTSLQSEQMSIVPQGLSLEWLKSILIEKGWQCWQADYQKFIGQDSNSFEFDQHDSQFSEDEKEEKQEEQEKQEEHQKKDKKSLKKQ